MNYQVDVRPDMFQQEHHKTEKIQRNKNIIKNIHINISLSIFLQATKY
jgi:hypothetical protein